jgi:hypothetical protein
MSEVAREGVVLMTEGGTDCMIGVSFDVFGGMGVIVELCEQLSILGQLHFDRNVEGIFPLLVRMVVYDVCRMG